MDQGTGARLQAAREERGATPDEVAAAIGIPPEAVADIERGDALRHYGPGLAAAWTWAVGRHLGVAIDHELATWQPPSPEDASGGPGAGRSDPPPGATSAADGAAPPSPTAPSQPSTDPAAREPKVQPGWLADFDEDPLEGFDPASAEAPAEAPPPRPAPPPGASDAPWDDDPWDDELEVAPAGPDRPGGDGQPQPAAGTGERAAAEEPAGEAPAQGSDDGTARWTPPEDDLWGPDAGDAWIPPRDEPEPSAPQPGDAPARHEPAAPARSRVDVQAPGDDAGDAGGTRRFDDLDSAGGPAGATGAAPHPRVPQPPDTDGGARHPVAEDTGELPSADSLTRVLAYTEGEDVPRLKDRSRLRTAGAVLAALVVLVGAGIGVGALAAQLLDDPAATDTEAAGGQGGAPADEPAGGEQPGGQPEQQPGGGQPGGADEPGSDDQPGDEPGGADEPADEPGSPGAGGIAGDPDAAPAASDTTVQILNGSGDADLYADVRDTLEGLGYQVIDSGPAAGSYEDTTVFVTDGFADEAAALVERDARFDSLQPNDVGLSEDVALHVVVGEQWDPSGT